MSMVATMSSSQMNSVRKLEEPSFWQLTMDAMLCEVMPFIPVLDASSISSSSVIRLMRGSRGMLVGERE